MKVSLFYLPSVGSRAQIEQGLAGLRPELYQQMLRELSEQAKLGDALGYDSISFTEHHFHVEGFELSNSRSSSTRSSASARSGSASGSSASFSRRRTRSASPRRSRCSTT